MESVPHESAQLYCTVQQHGAKYRLDPHQPDVGRVFHFPPARTGLAEHWARPVLGPLRDAGRLPGALVHLRVVVVITY
jgi:hypothetical protein